MSTAALPEVTVRGPPMINLDEGSEFSCWSSEVGVLVWAVTDQDGAEIMQEEPIISHSSEGLWSTLQVKFNIYNIVWHVLYNINVSGVSLSLCLQLDGHQLHRNQPCRVQ